MSAPRLWPMRGGITLPPNKAQSSATPIRNADMPPELILPLQQRGADAIPLVTIGQRVLKGEKIADAGDDSGAPLHAPSSGDIVAIESRPVALAAGTAPCIVLRCDGHDSWREREPWPDFATRQPAQLIARIEDAGVIGAGGAGFPAARKLVNAQREPLRIDTLIINGAECEPYITADDRLMRERALQIMQGVRVLQHIAQPQRVLIAIEDEQIEALAAMRAVAADLDVIAVPSIYPAGGEGVLIRTLTGREVPSDGHPADIGALCFNVGTVAAIARAVLDDEPMLSRIVTISGGACASPGNFDALIGTPLATLLAAAGRDRTRQSVLIAGGSMMGIALEHDAAPVMKTSHGFIAGTAAEFPPQLPAQPCIRCGACAEVCPAALLPQQLYAYARHHSETQLERHNLSACIECGACDVVCPSHIPLTSVLRAAKRELQVIAFERAQAAVARRRFQAHQERIARKTRAREHQRQQRLQRAIPAPDDIASTPVEDSKKTAIQAAIARSKAKKESSRRPAVAAALTDNETTVARLQRRIAELDIQIAAIAGDQNQRDYRDRLQRAVHDLREHLEIAEANPDAESTRTAIERALAAARGHDDFQS